MDTLLVVDMQVGLLNGALKHDLPGVVSRINALAAAVRIAGGKVIWIRHCGEDGDDFARNTPDWAFLPDLDVQSDDAIIEKTLNDPYVGTCLAEMLVRLSPQRVLVTGWATDFCVDATVRSTVSRGHHVVAVSDAHTVNDRPHLTASAVITHHNWVWNGLITKHSVRTATTAELLAEIVPSAGL